MKPRKNYRARPTKTGAKKRQKVLSQKKRLVAAGQDQEKLAKLSPVEIRNLLKETMKKKGPKVKTKTRAKAKA